MRFILRFLVPVFIIFSSRSVLAQVRDVRVGRAYSLEWLVSDADVIVRAKIEGESAVEHEPWFKVKGNVLETLKGEVPISFEFAARSNAFPSTRFQGLPIYPQPKLLSRYRGREVLLFLNANGRFPTDQTAQPTCPLIIDSITEAWSTIALDGRDDSDFGTTMDFAVLTVPDEIMATVRSAVEFSKGRVKPKPYSSVGLPLKKELLERMHGFNPPGITFPYDERLEQKACQWVKSDNFCIKGEGVRVLSRHRSDENVAILQSLLAETASIGDLSHVRDAARATLKRWGIDDKTDKP